MSKQLHCFFDYSAGYVRKVDMARRLTFALLLVSLTVAFALIFVHSDLGIFGIAAGKADYLTKEHVVVTLA